MAGRFSFMDDDEDEIPLTPIPGSFPSSAPNVTLTTPGGNPPILEGAPPESTPSTPESSSGAAPPSPTEAAQNIPSAQPGPSDIPIIQLPESVSDDQATDPDIENEVPQAPPDVGSTLQNGVSTNSSLAGSMTATPTAEEPTPLPNAIDGNASVSGSVPETEAREETPPPIPEPSIAASAIAFPPPLAVRIINPSIGSILEEPEDETPLVAPYNPPPQGMAPAERANHAADSFLTTGSLEAASQAITEFRNILSAGPEVPPAERARVAEALTTVLSQRFEHYGDVDDMEQAVETQLQLASFALAEGADPALRAKSHGGLGRTLTTQFEHTGDPDDAELAIEHLNKALEIIPQGDPGRPAVLADFAKAELAHYAHSDDPVRLEQALARCEEALNAIPVESPERTPLTGILGGALLSRFERTHDTDDIARAVEFLEFAAIHTPEGSPEKPKRLRSYGEAVLARADVENNLNSINTAIDIQRAALELVTPEHAVYPAVKGSLAKAFHIRYKSTNNVEDLDTAVDNFKTTVEFTPFTDPNHARITYLLGKSFMAKYRAATQPPRSHFLNYAITLHRQAVALTPPEHRHYAARLEALGKAYSKRYRSALRRQSAQQGDLDEAERCLTDAMSRDPSRADTILHELGKLNQQ
ncbi:unnamed protein product [Rhizoctonia solani]|uniref:Uncharacterized protein n=1 Tax=Rhizoctonia solani TaxID=456999 RepID=A0A8H3DFG1_9AGAM|nr:unnamed protein product [Rhizoctonia solani]